MSLNFDSLPSDPPGMCHVEGEERYRKSRNGSEHLGSSRSAPAFATWLYDSGTRPLKKGGKYAYMQYISRISRKQSCHEMICESNSKLKNHELIVGLQPGYAPEREPR